VSDWKPIRAPKTLYLPVAARDGAYDNSGQRVEPTDKLELLAGTNKIRINGVEHDLMRNIDDLINDQGVIQLAKPAPPVKVRSSGPGWSVGRMGEAARKAHNAGWDHEAAQEWQGDASTVQHPSSAHGEGTDLFGRATHARGFKIVQDQTPAYGKVAQQINFGGPAGPPLPDREWDSEETATINEFFDEMDKRMGDPNLEKREVTLRDGSTAVALFDKTTGQQVGTPQRMYQASYGEGGHQLPNAAPTHGPKATFDMDDYRRRMAAQMASMSVAPTTRERHDMDEMKKAAQAQQVNVGQRPAPIQTPITQPATSTGALHLDDMLGKTTATPGWPLGTVSMLYGHPEATQKLLQASSPSACNTLADAFGRIHLIRDGQTPIVAVLLNEELNDALRLDIAEQLPVLDNMIRGHKVAVVVVAPDWNDSQMPALLKFMPKVRVKLVFHETDQRFLTATLADGHSISFPAPG